MNTCRRCGDELPPLTTSVRTAHTTCRTNSTTGASYPVGLSY